MDYEPPLFETYTNLVEREQTSTSNEGNKDDVVHTDTLVETYELPLFDLGRLNLGNQERDDCTREIAEAASTWGFFCVVNHGVSRDLLKNLHEEEMKLFHSPFLKKSQINQSSLSPNSYRWGNPMAKSARQFSCFRSHIKGFAISVALIAETLAEILANNLGMDPSYFKMNCLPITSYVRLNRYPPCPVASKVFGLIPHSDTSFLTIVHEDRVGGLQFMRDGKWIAVKPNPGALIVNIGDLFQALSNGVYKSVKHRVAAATRSERFSLAFLYCPSNESVVDSNSNTPLYNKFSFLEYKKQTIKDLKETGDKVGLSRFFYHQE